MTHWRERQDRILLASGVPPSVTHAMSCWVDWMKGGSVGQGYPTKSAGFVCGGINCFDDMDYEAALYAAKAVDGVIKSLEPIPRTCIGIIWLGHTIHLRRINVEEVTQQAMKFIWRGLSARGVV